MAEPKKIVTKKTQTKKSEPGATVTTKADAQTSMAPPVSKKTASKKAAAKKSVAKKAPAAVPAKPIVTKKAPAAPAVTQKVVTKKATARPALAKKVVPQGSVVRNTPSKKVVSKKVAPTINKPLEERPVTLQPVTQVSDDERQKMIADAAYYRAEKRNFAPGHEQEDWDAAVAEVDAMLRKRGG